MTNAKPVESDVKAIVPITDANIDMLLRLLGAKMPPWADSPSTIYALIARIRQQAAAISQLTMERDEAKASEVAIVDQMTAIADDHRSRAEASEKRAKELGDDLKRANELINASVEDYNSAVSANKLLSERVAVLEGALEPFRQSVLGLGTVWPDATKLHQNEVTHSAMLITVGDLRRARTALEG